MRKFRGGERAGESGVGGGEGDEGVETRGRKLGVVEIYATATSDLSFTSI